MLSFEQDMNQAHPSQTLSREFVIAVLFSPQSGEAPGSQKVVTSRITFIGNFRVSSGPQT